ncbi:MAG TPA: hypothetical protein VHC94_01995 [Nitrobacter sp.]|jgi:hypothetical protein|nr:hypothetical protein [Nitrobacter sp.]
MRQMISGWVAAAALVAASAVPAMACGGGGLFTSGCAPCQAYVSPCAQSYAGYYGYGYYDRLPSTARYHAPTQYYYVNQGPAYTGPGLFAPVPTYQESAVSGWNAYSRPYYYPYDGGRYANAYHHYYDGARIGGPAIYSYRWHRHHRWHARPSARWHRRGVRYGYAPRHYGPRIAANPHVIYGSRHFGYRASYRHPMQHRHH